RQRIVGDDDRQAGFFHQQLVDVAQQRAAAGEHDAALRDVGAELRRRLLQRFLDGTDDALQGLLQGLEYLVAVQREAARHTFRQVASLDGDLAHFLARECRADLVLDPLRSGFADENAVVASHVVRDRYVEAVTADAHGGGVHDAVQRDHRDLGGAAADVEHHGAARFVHRHARTDRRRHRLGNEVHLARARTLRRLPYGTPLDLDRAVRHVHEHARARAEIPAAVRLADEVLQHLLGHGEVGDDAVLQRAYGGDVARGAAEHVLRFGTDRFDDAAAAPGVFPDRYDGRFVQYDAMSAGVDEGICGAKVDRHIVGEIP